MENENENYSTTSEKAALSPEKGVCCRKQNSWTTLSQLVNYKYTIQKPYDKLYFLLLPQTKF